MTGSILEPGDDDLTSDVLENEKGSTKTITPPPPVVGAPPGANDLDFREKPFPGTSPGPPDRGPTVEDWPPPSDNGRRNRIIGFAAIVVALIVVFVGVSLKMDVFHIGKPDKNDTQTAEALVAKKKAKFKKLMAANDFHEAQEYAQSPRDKKRVKAKIREWENIYKNAMHKRDYRLAKQFALTAAEKDEINKRINQEKIDEDQRAVALEQRRIEFQQELDKAYVKLNSGNTQEAKNHLENAKNLSGNPKGQQAKLDDLKTKINNTIARQSDFNEAITSGKMALNEATKADTTAAKDDNIRAANEQYNKAKSFSDNVRNQTQVLAKLRVSIDDLEFYIAIKTEDLPRAERLAKNSNDQSRVDQLKEQSRPTPFFWFRGSPGKQFVALPKPTSAIEVDRKETNLGQITFRKQAHKKWLSLALLAENKSSLALHPDKDRLEWTVTNQNRKIAKLKLSQTKTQTLTYQLDFEWLTGASGADHESLGRSLVKVLHPAFSENDRNKTVISFFARPDKKNAFQFNDSGLLTGNAENNGKITVRSMGEDCFLSYRLEFRPNLEDPLEKGTLSEHEIPGLPGGKILLCKEKNGRSSWFKTTFTGVNLEIRPRKHQEQKVYFADQTDARKPPEKPAIDIPLITTPKWLLEKTNKTILKLQAPKELGAQSQLRMFSNHIKHGPLFKCTLWCGPTRTDERGGTVLGTILVKHYDRNEYNNFNDAQKNPNAPLLTNAVTLSLEALQALDQRTINEINSLGNNVNVDNPEKTILDSQRDTYKHLMAQLEYFRQTETKPKITLHVKIERKYPGHGRVVLFTTGSID